MKNLTRESGSIIEGFSCNQVIDEALRSKAKQLKVSHSALIRYGIILAINRLEKKDLIKARKLIGIKT